MMNCIMSLQPTYSLVYRFLAFCVSFVQVITKCITSLEANWDMILDTEDISSSCTDETGKHGNSGVRIPVCLLLQGAIKRDYKQ